MARGAKTAQVEESTDHVQEPVFKPKKSKKTVEVAEVDDVPLPEADPQPVKTKKSKKKSKSEAVEEADASPAAADATEAPSSVTVDQPEESFASLGLDDRLIKVHAA